MYGFSLAGSNFLAPVLAGFINDGQGWQWVLVRVPRQSKLFEADTISKYWCAILCGLSFIILFFTLEETNFHREQIQNICSTPSLKDRTEASSMTRFEMKQDSKHGTLADNLPHDLATKTEVANRKKCYLQKLKLFDNKALRYPNKIFDMMLRPLIFLTFPVIFYAGFSYGSNLVWFNVLNGTASLILSKEPYGFSSSMVGLSYLSPLLGVTLGYVR